MDAEERVLSMRVLAIDASAKTAACAVADGEQLLCERFADNGLTHSETLLPMVLEMLNESGISPASLDRIGVTAGPGSFTGLRIGMATAKGLALAWSLPCAGVSVLEALALGSGAPQGSVICAVMDARCGNVYNALFRAAAGGPARLCPDRAIAVEALKKDETLQKNPVYLVGDGAEICYNKGNTGANWRLAEENRRLLRGGAVALLAQRYPAVPAAELRVEYIQLPQAQRELRARLSKQGKEDGNDCTGL